jgi:hypothetical protein
MPVVGYGFDGYPPRDISHTNWDGELCPAEYSCDCDNMPVDECQKYWCPARNGWHLPDTDDDVAYSDFDEDNRDYPEEEVDPFVELGEEA